MKKFYFIFTLSFLLALTAQTGFAQSAEEQKERLIKAVKFLELNPFDEKAAEVRGWAIGYATQTEGVAITLCVGDFINPAMDNRNRYGNELLGQYTIAMAAFKLENPAKKDNENAVQLAGVESMLRTYKAMVKADSNARFKRMDELVAQNKQGQLKTMIADAKCGRKTNK